MTCCLLGSLSGCASSPPVDIPEWDLTPAEVQVQQPIRLPELPSPVRADEEGAVFSPEAFAQLLEYATVAGGNYDIAVENAAALEAQAAAYNQLIEAGKLQRQFTQIREEQLAISRRDHFVDTWFYRVIIALGLLGAAL